MDQYVRRELNPAGLRLATLGGPSCADCMYSVSGMADSYSGAMTCRVGRVDVPVRQDFVCQLHVPTDAIDEQ